MTELKPGLWQWTGLHPDWTPKQGGPNGWEQEISCYYAETAERVLLIDPLVPPEDRERFLDALDRDVERASRPVQILVTCAWHARSSSELAERYGAPVWTFTPDAGPPPAGRVIDAGWAEEGVLWLEEQRALVSGDVILNDGNGLRLCPASWLPKGWTTDRLREHLRPLLDLPVELLLPTHGEPVVEGARERLAEVLSPRG